MQSKPWYQSKIIGLSALALVYSVYEHFYGPESALSFRSMVDMGIPLVTMVLRTWFSGSVIE